MESGRDEHFVFNESEMSKTVVTDGNEVNKKKVYSTLGEVIFSFWGKSSR